MTIFDFDREINRQTPPLNDAIKWGKYAGTDILPMWIADMDFAVATPIQEALQQRIAHGVLGYPQVTAGVVDAVLLHLSRDLGWQVDADWLVWLPGLVTGLNVACRSVGDVGDGVLTAVPIYPPFMSAPHLSHRRLQTFELTQATDSGEWRWDIDAMLAAADDATRLLMLCNPHNPVGRVWQRDELLAIADMAEQHDWIICSDDIHCELVLEPGVCYTPIASLSPEIARRTITLFAPSKTYNIPGLGASFAVVPDATLRRKFERAMAGIVPHINVLGYTGLVAAYTQGMPWRDAVLRYLRGNRDYLAREIEQIPGLKMHSPEATYLAWIDASDIPRPAGTSAATVFERAGLGLSAGQDFLPGGTDYVRLNFACTRRNLDLAISRLQAGCR